MLQNQTAPTWEGDSCKAWRDRMGGIRIVHEDGDEGYLQPGDDAVDLARTLDAINADAKLTGPQKDRNTDALLCDFLLDGAQGELPGDLQGLSAEEIADVAAVLDGADDRKLVEEAVEAALNAGCLLIQERIGSEGGDLAALFWTGENEQKVRRLFADYLRSERLYQSRA